MAKGDDHNRFTLNDKQVADFAKMSYALVDYANRANALARSAFRRGTKTEYADLGGFKLPIPINDSTINACPHCVHMLIHTLRETADLYEDVARRLELKEPAFDEWQRKPSE